MKNLLLIIGIVLIIFGILSLLLAMLNLHAYYNLRDGSAEHYHKLHKRAVVYFISGIILAIAGVILIVM